MTNDQKQSTSLKPFFYGILLVIFFAGGFVLREKTSYQLPFAQNAEGEEVIPVDASEMEIFWEVWNKIEEKYPFDDQEPSDDERIYAATAGMVSSFGDPHTTFLPPKETKLFTQDVSGKFGGVGMEVGMRDGLITVVAPLKGSPAEAAGLLPGDIIYKVDGVDVLDKNIDETISLIRGPKKTPVELTILRKDEPEELVFTIIRDTIMVPVIEVKQEGETLLIELYSFNAQAVKVMKEALTQFDTDEMDSFILDLRSNPGGFLDASIDIASMFLPEGTPIVSERGGEDSEEKIYRSSGETLLPEGIEMLVLVNGGSASASEIVAGALQEHDRAQLIGVQTFGKGSVQELIHLSDRSSLKVTIAKWYTPEGRSISDDGLEPDIEVEVTREDIENEFDPQLEKAFEILGE